MKKKVIGIIPARAGSTSIKHKNMVDLGGVPLINWCMHAAKNAKKIDRLVCSTNDPAVKELCREEDIEIIDRPERLGHDDTPVPYVIRHVLETCKGYNVAAWIQPTSPFVKSETIDECLKVLTGKFYASVQTITEVPHNHHAWNQRRLDPLTVKFIYAKERQWAYTKRKKPKYYTFGNFVATKLYKMLDLTIFTKPSMGLEVPRIEAFDVDGPEDLEIARYYARTYYGTD